MREFLSMFLCVASGCAVAQAQIDATTPKMPIPHLAADYGKLPLSFEANQGQVDKQVRFTSRGNGYSLFLTDSEAVIALSKRDPDPKSANSKSQVSLKTMPGGNGARPRLKTDVVRMQLAGAATGLKVEGEEKLGGTANYFIGNDPAKWHSSVPTFAKVKYKGVYPGVDLVYYGNQRQLEYDFVVAPGADPKQVKLHFDGAKKLKLTPSGDLEIIGKNGEIAFHKPVVYQVPGGLKAGEPTGESQQIEGKFILRAGKSVGFQVERYDKKRELVIDPTLAFSTYLGGTGSDGYSIAAAIAVDSTGSAYITGYTGDPSFPVTSGAYRTRNTNALNQPFVIKLNPAGSDVVYSTYFGGAGDPQSDAYDSAVAIAVDSSGSAYITGSTPSSDFPTSSGAFQTVNKEAQTGDLATPFVTKLNAAGTALVYSTFVGGSGDGADSDGATGITVDAAGHAFITGGTFSTDFPTTSGAFQTVNNANPNQSASGNQRSNAFVTELNTTGSALVYSTYLGGKGGSNADPDSGYGDTGYAITVDKSGDAYVTGEADSADFPLSGNAYQGKNRTDGGANVFVTKFNPSGSSLLYSTYLGGTGGDVGEGIALDPTDNIYVTGNAFSTNFPVTSGAFQTSNKSSEPGYTENAFISKLNPTTGELVYSTYLGGTKYDGAASIAVDSLGDVYVTGTATSTNFPVTGAGAYQPNLRGSGNAFVTELNPAGTALIYSTFLGGTMADNGVSIALDPESNFYVAGNASSTNFPTTAGAYLTTSPNGNPFAAKFGQAGTIASSTALTASPNPSNFGEPVTFTAAVSVSSGPAPTGAVSFYDGNTLLGTSALSDATGTFVASALTAGTHSIAVDYSGSSVDAASTASLTETVLPVAEAPTFTPAAGSYSSAQSITIADTTSGASIYYSTDSSTPTTSSTKYSGAVTVSATETLKAIAVASGYADSAVASATYTISSSSQSTSLQFIPITPCRIADTRNPSGPFGGPEPAAGSTITFNIPQSACNIPNTAAAYSLNVTVVPSGSLNYLTLWPSGQAQPNASTLNSDGRVKANAAIVPAGTNGGVSVFVSDPTQVIVDIDGYFAPAGTASALAFYPVTPCRIADTRGSSGPLGGPSLAAASSRSFPVQSSTCGLPATAQAYSLNVTAIPHSPLNYLTTWPTGEAQPNVSTLNSSTGAVTANAAVVPAGTSGAVSVFVSDAADVILDVNGYFAPPATGGLSLYTAAPCRVIDTRPNAFNGTMVVNVAGSTCAPPSTAQAYVLNATVVPDGALNFLTLWPDGGSQPNASTLNADDAAITSNMAIVPTTNGSVDAYADGTTNLILDFSGYFAP